MRGMSRGYGFVRFSDEGEQNRALGEMQGVYCETKLRVIDPSHHLPPSQALIKPSKRKKLPTIPPWAPSTPGPLLRRFLPGKARILTSGPHWTQDLGMAFWRRLPSCPSSLLRSPIFGIRSSPPPPPFVDRSSASDPLPLES